MIKAIIFDLNGVFVTSPWLSGRFKERFGISAEQFMPALSSIMDKVRLPGAEGIYNYWRPYLQEWGVPFSEEEFREFWFSAERLNTQMVKIAEILNQKGFLLFILSNNFRERTEYYNRSFPILNSLFRKLYYSWQTGFLKNGADAYNLLLEENHLQAGECLLFDDTESNVKLAESLGIDAHIYKDIDRLRKLLVEKGIAI
jgi:HAD superfamily hydrolase (TIGR01509 family)